MIIPVVLCLLYTAFFRVNAHGFATPKPVINYTSPLGTRPITCERFIQKSNSDLAICDGRIYRSSVYYCYSSKSRIRLKKCQRICGGGSEPEIKLCEERCPIYSTCNWGRKDENQTNCEAYYDYLDKFIPTTTPLGTTLEAETSTEVKTTSRTELKTATPSTGNPPKDGCKCNCPVCRHASPVSSETPHQTTLSPTNNDARTDHEKSSNYYVVHAYVAWIGLGMLFLGIVIMLFMFPFIIYLVFKVRQLRDLRNSPEPRVEDESKEGSEGHSSYNPVSQEDDDAASHEVHVDLSDGTAIYHRDGPTGEGETASAAQSRARNNEFSSHGTMDSKNTVDGDLAAESTDPLMSPDHGRDSESSRGSISDPINGASRRPRRRNNRRTSATTPPKSTTV